MYVTTSGHFMANSQVTHDEEGLTIPEPSESLGLVAKFASAFPSLAAASSQAYPVLFRATDGKSTDKRDARIKISTAVASTDLDAFFEKYVEVCRAGMSDGLRKRDRKKKEKRRKAKAKKAEKAEKKA
jgi:hypothetical protein